jgi:GMP synthase C terminal domain
MINELRDVNRVVLDITSKPRAPSSGSSPASTGMTLRTLKVAGVMAQRERLLLGFAEVVSYKRH